MSGKADDEKFTFCDKQEIKCEILEDNVDVCNDNMSSRKWTADV